MSTWNFLTKIHHPKCPGDRNAKVDMKSIRTTSLFHYTRLDNLKPILEKGLIPNFCKELDVLNPGNIIGIPMVSFCDIPLGRAAKFQKNYGRHAIGFTKEWGIKNGLSPIMYSTDVSIKSFQGASKSAIAYIKPMKGSVKDAHHNNYEENEWRHTVSDKNVAWFDDEVSYNRWRGDPKKKKPKPSKELQGHVLTFEIKDINFILIEQDNQIHKFIHCIKHLKYFGGMKRNLSPEEKNLLISRVISMERINKDI